MSLLADLQDYAKKTHAEVWTTRDGQKVPAAEDIKLGNEAVKVEATVLYADLAESTQLVKDKKDSFAAEVYKNYLYTAGKIIRSHGGVITSYDGDRIMAVFIDGAKNTNAAKCGLKIRWAVDHVLQPAVKASYPKSTFKLKQKVGIDTSPLFVARTGIRGSNDLVWVGTSANNAAKMAALPTTYSTYISAATYNRLLDSSKFGGPNKKNMWTDLGSSQLGYTIYGSSWRWSIS
ncbi:adenylate/guanylate cyclase domain-containing protein [Paenarthrobacter nitroguajacolicus]|uniref:adenylate/guanylate cyclase domain-containing protein n=1 Tax=Paenarthrobacter nitroguajacolicus TaxID=211146 RepID=UPI0015BE2339|nr:adenylate/guanylate cyclase domain-containing protein [Paenarthrobacter nitroguajacolicus]NWL10378.1 adenylate/guanylate cyclase domain-containing protein [Paenarthrobacter nitroguajacolicus]